MTPLEEKPWPSHGFCVSEAGCEIFKYGKSYIDNELDL